LLKIDTSKNSIYMRNLLLTTVFMVSVIVGLKAENITSLSDFHEVSVFGKLQVRLIQSDTMAIELKDAYEITHEVKNGVLFIKRTNKLTQPIETIINVYYKDINSINASGGAKIINRGEILTSTLNINAKTGTEIDIIVNVDSVNLVAKRNAMVYLTGSAQLLNTKLCLGSHLRTNKLKNENARVVLRGGSAEISATGNLTARACCKGILRYNKSVQKVDIKESMGGTSEILQE